MTVEQYVFRTLIDFDPEKEPDQQRVKWAMVSSYGRNAKALMDETDNAIASAPEELRDSWRSGWLPKTVPSRDDIRINRRALAVAFAGASIAGNLQGAAQLRNMRRIYALLGNGSAE